VRSRIPIRWKVAILSAGLTFIILCVFAVGVGELTQRRIRNDFQRQTSATADQLGQRVVLSYDPTSGKSSLNVDPRFFRLFQGGEKAAVRVVLQSGRQITKTDWPPNTARGVPDVGPTISGGYRVETRLIRVDPGGVAYIQYARPLSSLNATLRRVRLFLLLGVLGGTALALLGGLVLARRAMRPVVRLTDQANEIRRTRDPGLEIDIPPVEDEVGDLARALDAMLESLDEAQTETEAALEIDATMPPVKRIAWFTPTTTGVPDSSSVTTGPPEKPG